VDTRCRECILVGIGVGGCARTLLIAVTCGAILPLLSFAQTVPKLNDTGVTACYDASTGIACDPAARDSGSHPRQDARYGRDAKNGASQLTKVGAGNAGFDYTKICGNGDAEGSGTCPANPPQGSGATEWSCTRDNVTGLVWELKTTSAASPHFSGHKYTWYSTNSATNGGNAGNQGNNSCNGTLPGGLCNTEAFVIAMNTAALCGNSDWRIPNELEFQSIIDYSKGALAFDTNFLPNSAGGNYWTSRTTAFNMTEAFFFSFNLGDLNYDLKTGNYFVQAVRGGL